VVPSGRSSISERIPVGSTWASVAASRRCPPSVGSHRELSGTSSPAGEIAPMAHESAAETAAGGSRGHADGPPLGGHTATGGGGHLAGVRRGPAPRGRAGPRTACPRHRPRPPRRGLRAGVVERGAGRGSIRVAGRFRTPADRTCPPPVVDGPLPCRPRDEPRALVLGRAAPRAPRRPGAPRRCRGPGPGHAADDLWDANGTRLGNDWGTAGTPLRTYDARSPGSAGASARSSAAPDGDASARRRRPGPRPGRAGDGRAPAPRPYPRR
jgi:hypothetical protein